MTAPLRPYSSVGNAPSSIAAPTPDEERRVAEIADRILSNIEHREITPEETKLILAWGASEQVYPYSFMVPLILQKNTDAVAQIIQLTDEEDFYRDVACLSVPCPVHSDADEDDAVEAIQCKMPLLHMAIIAANCLPNKKERLSQEMLIEYLHQMFSKIGQVRITAKGVAEETAERIVRALQFQKGQPMTLERIRLAIEENDVPQPTADELAQEVVQATRRWVNVCTKNKDSCWPHSQGMPLHIAACHHLDQVIEYLIEMGACVDAKDPEESTPLFSAISSISEDSESQVLKTVQALLKGGANPNIRCGQLMPLNEATRLSTSHVLQLLVASGAFVNCVNACCLETPLFTALNHHNVDLFEAVLALPGCNMDVRNLYQETVVHSLVKMTPAKAMRALRVLKEKCSPEQLEKWLHSQDKKGAYPIHQFFHSLFRWKLEERLSRFPPAKMVALGVSWQFANQLQKLRDKGELIFAVPVQEIDALLTLLIEHNPSTINLQDADGNTLLHLAVQYKMDALVALLLSKYKECNPSIKNGKELTPLALAIQLQREKLIAVFRDVLQKMDRQEFLALNPFITNLSVSLKQKIELKALIAKQRKSLPPPKTKEKKIHPTLTQHFSHSSAIDSAEVEMVKPEISDADIAAYFKNLYSESHSMQSQGDENFTLSLPKVHSRVLAWQRNPEKALKDQHYLDGQDPQRTKLYTELGERAVIEAHAFPSLIDEFVFLHGYGVLTKNRKKGTTTTTCVGIRIEKEIATPVQFTYVQGKDGSLYHRLMTCSENPRLYSQMEELERQQGATAPDVSAEACASATPLEQEDGEPWTTVTGPNDGWVAQTIDSSTDILLSKIGSPVSYRLQKPQ